MTLPIALIESLRGLPGFDETAFVEVHGRGEAPVSVRMNPAKPGAAPSEHVVPWCPGGRYLAGRPSFILDPSWHAGRYYVQEASSMFVEQAFRQYAAGLTAPRVLDACAAPGGKSTHLQALIGDGLLVSNEVIRTRVGILSENTQRWGGDNVVVTSADPRAFGAAAGYFDVVLVDAPCSGSGLFRREPEAIKEWSPELVDMCGQRQQRILADLWCSLREGGLLIYSTCSYSFRENEAIVDWLTRQFAAEPLPVALDPSWGIVASGGSGYRFYPYLLEGEGLFMACLRKTGAVGPAPRNLRPASFLSRREAEPAYTWLSSPDGYDYLLTGETIRALPAALAADMVWLSSLLPVRQAGVAVGQPTRKELVPDPALALSLLPGPQVPRLELTLEQALGYVRKDDLRIEGAPQGWAMVTYEGYGLGWVKVLPGRINNYWPKSWRVLKR